MADITDIIGKLVQLALKNPSREEAAAAALKAVELIDKYQIPIGATIVVSPDVMNNWKPPDAGFMSVVEDILKGKSKNPDEPIIPKSNAGYSQGLSIQDNDLVDPQEAWRRRMVDAWQAIRDERKKIDGEWYRLEKNHNIRRH